MSLPGQLQERLSQHQEVERQNVSTMHLAGSSGDSSLARIFSGIVGRSASMERLLSQMRSAAPHLRIATIEGEPGTGKSLVAEHLRINGPLRTGTLLRVRAFDLNDKINGDDDPGRWSTLCTRARNGMLLLEEAEKLLPSAQMTILNHLNESSLCTTQPFDRPAPMQLLVTSSRSLRSLVAAGTFSRELAFRLTAMRFVVPPLRERREDISILADHFIAIYAARYGKTIRGLDPAALACLLNHDWRGNVRELESVIEAACLEAGVQWIRPIDLRLTPGGTISAVSAVRTPEDLSLDGAIQRHIADILVRTRGNKLRTARILGISRSTLYRMLPPAEPL